ncbi:hypothetical protein [Microvirga sesbaniae]|uniref:COG3904 family protein n=1 Tax=Microvirga sesbaniae TaxID=681392 RepID=UPI0021C7ECCB|nr:hypothetical protein [Microvirga sp. HBU67692]
MFRSLALALVSVTLCSIVDHALAQSIPDAEECAVRWHVPFGSPLRATICTGSQDKGFCERSRIAVKAMDQMYSTCMAVVEASRFEGRHPARTSALIDQAAAMIAGGQGKPQVKLTRVPDNFIGLQACNDPDPPSACLTKYRAVFQSDIGSLATEYRRVEKITPRLEVPREQVAGYRPSPDRMVFMKFSAGASVEFLTGYGVITPETPRDFEAYLLRNPDERPKSIRLNSPGGSLIAGLRLGELFRENGYSTSIGGGPFKPQSSIPAVADFGGDQGNQEDVPEICMSACAYAFLGGISRDFGEKTRYGVHQFYNEKATSEPTAKAFDATDLSFQQVMTGLIVDYIVRMGADARLIVEAAKAEYDTMRVLSQKEARDLKVIYDPESFTAWQILPRGRGVIARSISQDGNRIAQVACFTSKRGTERKFVIWQKGANAGDWRDLAKMAVSFQFAGMVIPTESLNITTDGKNVYFSTDLPLDYEKRISSLKVDLEFFPDINTAPMVTIRSFVFPPIPREGFAASASIALRNCLPAS